MKPAIRIPFAAIAALPTIVVVVFFVTPLLFLFFVSFMTNSPVSLFEVRPTLANYLDIATDPFVGLVIQRTLSVTLTVLTICLLLGYPVALLAAGMAPRGRMVMLLLLVFPLMVSNVVRAYGWVTILSRQGLLNNSLMGLGITDRPLQFLYSFDALTMGLLTILLPYMIVSIANSLTTIDRSYYEAAESLGAGPVRKFLRVTLPLSTPGVASGLMMVTFLTLSAYVTIALLGGARYKLLVSLAFDSASTFRWPRAAAFAFILLAIAMTIAAIIQLVLRPHRVQGRGR